MQIAIVLILLVVAIILFARETFSVDIITLMLLIALVLSRTLTPEEAFAGFSTDIIIILASIFVISGAVQQTGVMEVVGEMLNKVGGGHPTRLIVIVMAVVGLLSGIMNNTAAVAVFIPPIIGLAKKSRVSASKLLMPMAFGSILGGTCTLIGTSTNIAVSGYLGRYGMTPVSLFEITPVGLILLAIGIAYMAVFGHRLLPDRKGEDLTQDYAIREYLSEIVIPPDSHMIGQKIFESDLARSGFRVLEIFRDTHKLLPGPQTTMQGGDVLLVEGKVKDLIKVKATAGMEIVLPRNVADSDLESADIKLAEALVMPQSDLVDRTLKELQFRQRYGVAALAIYRHGHSLREKVGYIRLKIGDLLLVQGPAESLKSLRRNPDLWVLGELNSSLLSKRKGLLTLLFFLSAIVSGGLGWLPLSVAFLISAVASIAARCITVEEAREFIDWRLLILIGGMTAFGTAMDKSGTALFLADNVVRLLEPLGIISILAGFVLLTILLTQPMSNAAAALVVLPVALTVAKVLGANPRTFAVAIMLAASISLIAPFEPACLLVYGPGKYRLTDFVRNGLPLTLILVVVALLLLPLFWPLYPVSGH